MRATVGFCRSNLMYAISGALTEEQGINIKRIHTLFPLKHPDVKLFIQDGNENCKVRQVRVVRSIFHVRNFSLYVGVNKPLGLTTTWLGVVRDRYSLSLTTATGERVWIYCNDSVCTLAQCGAAFCSAKLQQNSPAP